MSLSLQISPHVAILILCSPHIVSQVVPPPHKSHCTSLLSPHQTILISHPPCIVCQVVIFIMQKSLHVTILISHGHYHLTSTLHCVSSCPLHHAKVTSHDHSHLVLPFSSCIPLECPLHVKIISFTWCGKIPKKSCSKTYEPPMKDFPLRQF